MNVAFMASPGFAWWFAPKDCHSSPRGARLAGTIQGEANSTSTPRLWHDAATMTVDTTLDPGLAVRERVLEELRQAAPRLRARGITHLSLFGSMARGEAGPTSDVDLLIEVDRNSRFSLFDLVNLQDDLLGLLMRPRRDLRLRLEHILRGVARIEQLAAGKTVEDYLADEGLREMIERNIARISEAARHIPAGVKAKYPAIP